MKILLIEVKSTSNYIHNGLAYLASSLYPNHQIKIIDLNLIKYRDQDLVEEVLKINPDIIGFSMKSSNMSKVKQVASLLKQKSKSIFVVGGPHITLFGTDFFKQNNNDIFNYGFIGEAEASFAEFCNKIEKFENINNIAGLIYFNNQEWIANSIQYNKHLDEIKFPDYTFFIGLDWSIIDYPLLTSRGCPYQCIYCSVNKVSGLQWRYRSPESIIKELKKAKQKYNIKRFAILDDNFTLNKQRVIDFCNLLIKENLNLSWGCPNGLRADSLDGELISKMKKANCDSVSIGIESGDPKVFDFIKKGEKLEDIKKAINLLNKYQIKTVGFCIVGLPYDSIKSTKKSLKFIESLNISGGIKWSMLVPYPKTFIWDWVKKNGRFLMDFTQSQHFNKEGAVIEPAFETNDFSAKQRKKAFILANISTGMYHIVIKKTKIKLFYKIKILFYLLKYNYKLFFKKLIYKIT